MRIPGTTWHISFRAGEDLEKHRQDRVLGELQHDLTITRWIVGMFTAAGFAALGAIWREGIVKEAYAVVFWALACFAMGTLLGFLFGVPRVIQNQSQSRPDGDVKPSSSYRLIVNTNLDDVSDWLTKIVIGVGLVELEKIPALVKRLAAYIGGEVGAHTPFISAVIVYFSAVGFISGYLTTRMFFQRAFRIADKAASDDPHMRRKSGDSANRLPQSQGPMEKPPVPVDSLSTFSSTSPKL